MSNEYLRISEDDVLAIKDWIEKKRKETQGKQKKWIKGAIYQCSECGAQWDFYGYAYCPFCGAKMEVSNE